MSPKWSNSTKVSSFLRTCGFRSCRAEVAATYHLLPMRILSAMRMLLDDLHRAVAPAHVVVDVQVALRHRRRGESAFERCSAVCARDLFDASGRGDCLGLIVD